MPATRLVRALLLLFCATVALTGCGGSASTTNLTPTPATDSAAATTTSTPAPSLGPVQTDAGGHFSIQVNGQPLNGAVSTDRPVTATVTVYALGGGRYRVQATTADGLVLVADSTMPQADQAALRGQGDAPIAGTPQWIWVTPVSTLYAVYGDAHPTSTANVPALRRVKQYLGLRESESINRPYISTRVSTFSPRVFLRAAGTTDLVTYARSLVATIDAGGHHLYVESDFPLPSGKRADALSFDFGFTDYIVLGVSKLIPGARAASATKFLGANVGVNLLADVIWKGIGLLCGKMNGGNMTQTLLNNISAQIGQLSNQVNSLSNFSGTDSLAQGLTGYLTQLSAFTQNEIQTNNNALAGQYTYNPLTVPGGHVNDMSTQGPFSAFVSLLDAGTANLYAHAILDRLLNMQGEATYGLGNLYTGYAQQTAQQWGSSNFGAYGSTNWVNYYDFRSDTVTTTYMQGCMGYYAGYVVQAANMLTESEARVLSDFNVPNGDGTWLPAGNPTGYLNQGRALLFGYLANSSTSPGGNPPTWTPTPQPTPAPGASPTPLPPAGALPAAGPGTTFPQVVGGTAYQNGIFALLNRAMQQQPMALLDDGNPLPGVWLAPADAETTSGFVDANSHMDGTLWAAVPGLAFTSKGDSTGQNFANVFYFNTNGWTNWYVPTQAEVQKLFSHAQQIGAKAGKSSDIQVVYGLYQMGLIDETSYNHAINDSGIVEVYDDFSVDKYGFPHLYVYRNDNGKNYNNGLYNESEFYPYFVLKPQNGHLAVMLMCRPFPGISDGRAAQGAPDFIANSATGKKVAGLCNGALYAWNTDLPLAGNYIPDEIVISQDPSNPAQLHAWGLWIAGQKSAPQSTYGNLGLALACYASYPPVSYPYYVMYTDMTSTVEWLSSDTRAVEVSNMPTTAITVLGGTASGVNSTAGTAVIENAVADPDGTLHGGNLIAIEATTGTISGGTAASGTAYSGSLIFAGPTPTPSPTASPTPTPPPATISNATVSGGTMSGGTTYNLSLPATPNVTVGTVTMNATVTNATISGGVATVPTVLPAGLLTVHDSTSPVTVTASWMFSPSTTNATNNPTPSTAQYIPGGSTTYANGNSTFTLTPLETPFTLNAGALPQVTGLNSITISPNNTTLALRGSGRWLQQFFLTGMNNDGTYGMNVNGTFVDYTTSAQWQVFVATPQGQAQPTTLGAALGFLTQSNFEGYLDIEPGFSYNGLLAIRATVQGKTAYAFIDVNSHL